MAQWFSFAIGTLILWGFWGFLPKLTTQYITPKSAIVWEVVGGIVVALVILMTIGFKPETHPKGILFAVLTGMFGVLGAFTFLFAISKGKASVVVTVTALYPIVVIPLAYLILHETLTVKQGFGMLFALVAMVLFAS